jgi:Cys-rich four helix bundle protein (predicted Tat secretion target)
MQEPKDISQATNVSRRSLIAAGTASGLGLAALMAANTSAQAEGEHDTHGDHAKHGASPATTAPRQALIDAALKCVNHGIVCVNHCLTDLGTGSTMLKDCIRSVSAMIPMCEALAKLGALDAARLKDLAKVCIDVCDDCAKECKKHAEHHAQCKACGESCLACIEECKKVI